MTFTKKDALKRLFLCPGMNGISQGASTAVRICLLYFTVSQAATSSPQTTNCASNQFDEISQVRYIHDGDTLHLSDGRKVRLIGINTPEVARDNRPAEPYAVKAKNTLKSLFKNDRSITLVFGKDKKDHYGRYLAHAFLADGTNVQAEILQQGLASAIAIPPNIQFASCYLDIERSARCNKAGLWKNTAILDAKDLDKQHFGFRIIKGTVNAIKTNNKGIWLNLDNKLTIGIRSKDQDRFDLRAVNNMLNQTIIVRGWLNKSNKSTPFYLRTRHPLSIQLSSSFACH